MVSLLLLSAGPALAAGSEPVSLGADGPWIAIPAGTPVQIGPLSDAALDALADLDGDPAVTTAEERAMRALLRQVLGLDGAAGPAR